MILDATIYLWGNDLVPEEVSAVLEAIPTHAVRKGEARTARDGRGSVARTGMWSLRTSALVVGTQAPDHVKFLTDRFADKVIQLRQAHQVERVRISILVSPDVDEDGMSGWSDEIPADMLGAIAGMGASLAVTVLCPSGSVLPIEDTVPNA